DVFADHIEAAFAQLAGYDVDATDALRLFYWAAAQLRNRSDGLAWPWIPELYQAWVAAGYPVEALRRLGRTVLDRAAGGRFESGEVRLAAGLVIGELDDTARDATRVLMGD